MSDYLAVAGVSAVLRSLLTTALTNGGPATILVTPPGVTANPPDLVPTGANEQPRVNLFMYYASLNPALRNTGLPSRNSQGTPTSNEPLALNLHYLVSAYGSTQFDPEILLAWAMKVLHDNAVVPRATIQAALSDLLSGGGGNPEAQLVAASTLANQIEHIRITPEALTTQEIYNLWTAFQTTYRPTTSYQVSVVVIQDTQQYASNLPVQQRAVLVLPLSAPVIDNLVPNMVAIGGTLTVNGRNFIGDSATNTLVSFDGAAGIPPATVQSTCVRVSPPPTLLAGTRTVRVLRTVTFPLSSTPHPGFSSSPVPFQLLPTITNAPPITVARGGTLTLTLSPAVGSMQQAVLYVGDQAVPIDQRSVTGPPTSATLNFPIPANFQTGSFPVRVEIDGAQSRLTVDTNPSSATFGQFLPQVQVTP